MGIYTTASYFVLMALTSLAIHALPAPTTDNATLQGVFQGWVMLQATDWWLLLLAGAIFTVALLAITQAYRIAVVSVVAPFEYVYILWASLVGYLIFADVPGPRTMIGGAVIVISGCYIILRESHVRAVADAGN